MTAQYQFFGTLRATCRVWDADAGGVPANWELPGFDDSAWPLSATPTQSNSSYPNEYVQEGIQAIAPWVTPPTTTTAFLFRFHFNAPAKPPWNHWQWDFKQPGGNMALGTQIQFFINGTSFLNQNVPVGQSALYNYGSDNVIAGFLSPSGVGSSWGTDAWCALRQIFYTPTIGSQAYAWGTVTAGVNDKGFLGVGDTATHLTPTACVGLPGNVAKVASNGKTTWFLTSDGDVWACGDNSAAFVTGGIAGADSSVHATPTLLVSAAGNNPVADISIGQDCAMYVRSDGSVSGWGPNVSGSLGLGDTAPRVVPTGLGNSIGTILYPGRISAGKNFSILASTVGNDASSAGNNTYGQLGQGTSGAAVTTRTTMVGTNYPLGLDGNPLGPVQVSAGDDQTMLLFNDGIFFLGNFHLNGKALACGRAEFGSLGGGPYASGTGPNKIQATPVSVGSPSFGGQQIQQAGPVSFIRSFVDSIFTLQDTVALGDGTPFGGVGDGGWDPGTGTYLNSPTVNVWGKPPQTDYGHVAIPIDVNTANFLWPIDGLAESGAGSQNPWTAGNSKAVFAAFGYWSLYTSSGNVDRTSDGLLYTWGWGGAGQMGSGADATTNISPIAVNGLSNVIGATVVAAAMFAISAIGVTVTTRRGRSFGSVV